MCADGLNDADDCNQHHDGKKHDGILITIIALHDSHVAEASAAHCSAHRRIAENGGCRDGEVLDKRRNAFRNHHPENDLKRGCSHGFRGFDDVFVNLSEACFDQSCHKRERRHHQRNYACRGANRRSDDHPRKRNGEHHEYQKRHRAQNVYHCGSDF